jgi:hypothetical protein
MILNIGQILNSIRPIGCGPKRLNRATRLPGPTPTAAQPVTKWWPRSRQRWRRPPVTAAPRGLVTLSPRVGAIEESSRTSFPPRARPPSPLLRSPLPAARLAVERHHCPLHRRLSGGLGPPLSPRHVAAQVAGQRHREPPFTAPPSSSALLPSTNVLRLLQAIWEYHKLCHRPLLLSESKF